MTTKSLAIQIILPKGEPDGLKIIELTGWDGQAVSIPRTKISEIKNHPEYNIPALYLLFGQDEELGQSKVYIGEASRCSERLTSHNINKDFWNHALVFLNPPNRKNLESEIINRTKEANRFQIINTVQPLKEKISEFDSIKNNHYLNGVEVILEVFNYPMFQSIQNAIISKDLFYLKGDDYDAKAHVLNNGQIKVLQGSIARQKETLSFSDSSKKIRKEYLNMGIITIINPRSYEFTKDVVFKSPSAASDAIIGRSTNGWTYWKNKDNQSLDEVFRTK